MWTEITDMLVKDWPKGNWVITWVKGKGWKWQPRFGAERQKLYEEGSITRAGLKTLPYFTRRE